jgi:hypothetical protein
MMEAVARFKEIPAIVYLRENGIKQRTCVSYHKFLEMQDRWEEFKRIHGREPNFVWVNKPPTNTSSE